MMKHIFIVLLAAMALSSCDVIKEGDRLEPADGIKSKTIVLLEEFTGVRCTNCPAAAKIAHDLLTTFPDNVVVVGLHGKNTGDFGTPFEGEQDFRVAGVEDIFEAMGGTSAQGYPCGMINRISYNESLFLNSDSWIGNAVNEMVKPPVFDIIIEKDNAFSGDSNQVKVNVSIETLDLPETGEFSLVVQVIEDGIIGTQVDGGEYVKDYVHNHVLRSFVNGTWGEAIAPVNGETTTKSYTITFEELWVMENCSIVAYIYNSKTKRTVFQAAILPISNNTAH